MEEQADIELMEEENQNIKPENTSNNEEKTKSVEIAANDGKDIKESQGNIKESKLKRYSQQLGAERRKKYKEQSVYSQRNIEIDESSHKNLHVYFKPFFSTGLILSV